MSDAYRELGYLSPADDLPGVQLRSNPIPPCCKWGYSEEGFVHQWLKHFDDVTKDSALGLAEDGSAPWKRWAEAALKAEAGS